MADDDDGGFDAGGDEAVDLDGDYIFEKRLYISIDIWFVSVVCR
jgi:hypothetical protein